MIRWPVQRQTTHAVERKVPRVNVSNHRMALHYCFVVDSKMCGYHVYKEIWPNPFVGEDLPCEREICNPHDTLAVMVKKVIGRLLVMYQEEYLFCLQYS